jgi:hypothetical protein
MNNKCNKLLHFTLEHRRCCGEKAEAKGCAE